MNYYKATHSRTVRHPLQPMGIRYGGTAMTLDYHGIGRWPDSRWEVECPVCLRIFYGVTEGDTGASYYEPGYEDDAPIEDDDLCRQCHEKEEEYDK